MKIALFEMEDWECSLIQQEGKNKWQCPSFARLEEEHEVKYLAEDVSKENASKFSDVEMISVFIYSSLDKEALEQLPSLKFIATRSTGYDHIDLEYCRKKGVLVSNVPAYGENTVAEHVFALLFTLSHRILEAVERTRKGNFSPRGLRGFDLRGKTIGIIGTGHIGQHVIRMANGFEMKVIAYDINPDYNLQAKLGFQYTDFNTLLQTADIISLHIPGGENTRHLIDEKAISLMKKGTVLINTARGDLIESKALLIALKEGKIAGAGLDVLPEEPVIKEEAELIRTGFSENTNLETLLANHLLLHMQNVIITPHSAFNTREAIQRILTTTEDNLLSYASGTPQNLVAGP